ncbi:hypothetical protein AB0L75_28330 [Streptomyces sp. NPDC052101]|uniref:hypothetical protein n=1 Tax=Streptomyces sp. NPDC052101 TaxID=3155763 RepID=UPI00343473B8
MTQEERPHLSDHFHFGVHPEHGFVAAATANVPAHLAHWYLERVQFEPVPDTPGLYRLANPEQDGLRRARQAVQDLRVTLHRHGYTVGADYALEPALASPPAPPEARNQLVERRSRIAQAAATRSPQRASAPAATPARPLPQAGAVPAAGRTQSAGSGQGR